ncbi:hypothetical protein ETB55_21695 [Salmonella enterica subsp. enterica serovar Omuna]|nr:hypothetical protein [Salmonella enterica subsp. enterica serovar Omuna]
MFIYPVQLVRDDATGSYIASCRDLPLMNSVGDTVEEALLEAVDGLVTAISIEVDERRPIPAGSELQDGEYPVTLPVLVAMKSALHNAMIATGTRKAELARLMGQKAPAMDRLLNVEHSSKVETVEHALNLLNRRVSVEISEFI